MFNQTASKALLVTGASNIDQYKYPAAAIVSPVEVSDANKNAQFATEVDMYRQKDFCQFLRCISAALVRDCNDDFSINLRVYRHRIALHYNATQEKWLLQDPNGLPGNVYLNTPTGRADLAVCLYRNIGAGAKGAVVCCHMSLYGRAGKQGSLRSRMSLFQRLFEKVERPAGYLKRMRTGCDIFGETLLNLGCCMGDVDVCENALIAGADVNVEVRKGKATPLLLACSFGHEGVVEVLLKYGATIGKAVDRLTPLHVARVSGYPRIARLLLNALQQQKTKSGTATMKDLPASTELSPLLQACQLNDAKMVGQLLFAGADVELSRPDGFRPLHIACQNGNATIVEMLLKAGADTHVKVKAKTPASIARHHHAIAKLLKKYHGNKPIRRVSGSSLFQITGINPCVKPVNNAVLGMPVSPSSLSY
ncbi:MAG: ankyrin repeat domain-containing protein [Coxiellaceae bacterium]|nr:ankyrin repeat domain-containing protein [Coxiellaceae bacterium]